MGVRSQGRGTAAAVGLFLLFAGLVGGGVLYVVAERRPAQSVEGFARAPVGCTTTLDFTETGTFYVYEEVGTAAGVADGNCQPVAVPGADFEVVFTGDLTPVTATTDDSNSYDVDGFDGRSILRVELAQTGQYSVAVTGSDLTVVAALGRDPDDGVDGLVRAAVIVAIGGVALGLLLLVLSGRRSKKAATVSPPDGPGRVPSSIPDSRGPDPTGAAWPPEAPRVDQAPINPHAPPPTPEPEPPASGPSWQPPSGEAASSLPPPEPSGEPTLPEQPGRPSGT